MELIELFAPLMAHIVGWISSSSRILFNVIIFQSPRRKLFMKASRFESSFSALRFLTTTTQRSNVQVSSSVTSSNDIITFYCFYDVISFQRSNDVISFYCSNVVSVLTTSQHCIDVIPFQRCSVLTTSQRSSVTSYRIVTF